MVLKIFELTKKNFPINEAVEPKAIKTKEKPKAKKIVLTTIKSFLLSISLSNIGVAALPSNRLTIKVHRITRDAARRKHGRHIDDIFTQLGFCFRCYLLILKTYNST